MFVCSTWTAVNYYIYCSSALERASSFESMTEWCSCVLSSPNRYLSSQGELFLQISCLEARSKKGHSTNCFFQFFFIFPFSFLYFVFTNTSRKYGAKLPAQFFSALSFLSQRGRREEDRGKCAHFAWEKRIAVESLSDFVGHSEFRETSSRFAFGSLAAAPRAQKHNNPDD